ncbi:Transposase and inactivated derivatives, IS5 family [Salegentibacter salegens]|uniref:Transposase and inactivated derivatives, IS5 family n=5 Tax=Salegentibacter salegens TaxID=143223 RepID=A0A1M7HV00_9FLAO|nr:IS5 family transposase [Salegentibacter salegens]SHM32248.1 Transposase and inactivated derivatives, IS5 family [Salegentibacter salegens]SHM51412.1 Transposase and inactivated derivatives, IS5 family [Salegentibacter salegens]SHM99075.1 Transposase and inactivated derivatives, IS5 family [Salegentibacter salegens]SHN06500.1 Transposase and inactivated derivatives, IS5 family [Salegentibacter salegens]SHN06952.1 Transposase and inactivated derivatives, IS5 family [Salegentibacter salegens]
MSQLSFSDIELGRSRKPSRVSSKLNKINNLVEWDKVFNLVQAVDNTNKVIGGAPHRDLSIKVKMLFLQHLYNLSDPELEDQVNDRLSFQKFAGINYTTTVPDFTTIWRFKEALVREGLMDGLFALILASLESKGLLLKKGTSVDATILQSTTKPLSKERREELEKHPSAQIDTDAQSTAKRGKKYFGYKGHIGTDVGSELIRKRTFTSARPHDSQLKDELLSGDEQMIFGDSAYGTIADKRKARKEGVYYGMLDKGTRKRKLSATQKKNNKKKSKIRCKVEHPFAYLKEKLNYKRTVAKTMARNELRFDFNCILYNIFRASYLLSKA